MDRRSKQILYGSVFALVFVGALSAFYFFALRPVPSCVDNIRNQNEEGIDCGGSCAEMCQAAIRPIELAGSPQVFFIDSEHSSVLVKIQNPNDHASARSFSYAFELRDGSGNTLETVRGQSFVAASEVKYIFVPRVSVSANVIREVVPVLGAPEWLPADQFIKPKLLVQNYDARIVGREIHIEGTLVNKDSRVLSRIDIIGVFHSHLGPAAGASGTKIDRLGVSESRAFTVIYPNFEGADLQATEVFVSAFRP